VKYSNYFSVMLLAGIILLTGCGKKDPLKGISKIAIVGVSYSKGIEKNGSAEITLFNPVKGIGSILKEPPLGNPPPKAETTELKKEENNLGFGIDKELKLYFDSVISDLSRMIAAKDVVIITANAFAQNETFATLKKDKNDTVLKQLTFPIYSPEPYASAVHPHKKEVLAKLAQELGVDAILTIKLSIVEETHTQAFNLGYKKLGIQSQIGLIDKNGKTILNKGWVTRVMGDSEIDANALMFGNNSHFEINVDNTYELEKIRKKYLAKMAILMARRS
jgi:hypothetical protein